VFLGFLKILFDCNRGHPALYDAGDLPNGLEWVFQGSPLIFLGRGVHNISQLMVRERELIMGSISVPSRFLHEELPAIEKAITTNCDQKHIYNASRTRGREVGKHGLMDMIRCEGGLNIPCRPAYYPLYSVCTVCLSYQS
jgi:hypothetical protein